jgi:predicted CXXCH cytochrome family protein
MNMFATAMSAVLAAVFLTTFASPGQAQQARATAQYVDEAGCAACHAAQAKAWTGSDHRLAMQSAREESVLGDFNDARFTHAGVTTRFFRRSGKFFVNTDGPDGKLADFEVKYAFGVDPLQQYLIELPGGRLQALSIAWDAKRKRWFHLYPRERVDYRDELHWTAPAQNWNHMCGECHATAYRKNYDAASGIYKTSAARFDVGCQACHGPASRHAEWAKRAGQGEARRPREEAKRDFDVDLAAKNSRQQIDTCARCHARRGTLTAEYRHGAPLMDTHLPALLSERLYQADGQILDEVYEYGSFLQSRMQAKGVRCSDCHEPHSTRLRAAGNALCVTCHSAATPAAGAHIDTGGLKRKDYDSPAHHFHKAGRPGSRCVDCHAPARTYMIVDPRRDHSFRIPRPDVSAAIGTPNACTGCHARQSAKWAADAVARWYGQGRRQEPHYGLALDAGRLGKAGAVQGLIALADDRSQPAIVRATALDLLTRYPGRSVHAALRRGLGDGDAMVRRVAVLGQQGLEAANRIAALAPLLNDPVRSVRIEAARLLAPAASSLAAQDRKRFDAALAEFEAVQAENADRPEALASLGNLYLGLRDLARAEAAYRKAIVLDARFVPAYVNLADLYRGTRREADAERTLREGLRQLSNDAALRGALGLALVRQGRKKEALAEFAAAAKAAPDEARHAYVYAISLDDAGRRAEARKVLEAASKRRGDRDVLLALAAFKRDAGDRAGAEQTLRVLEAINPGDPALGR